MDTITPNIFPKNLILSGFIPKNEKIDSRLQKGLNFKPSDKKDVKISKDIVSNYFGIQVDQIKLLTQNHHTDSVFVTSDLQTENIVADAMFTNQQGIFLASKSADCPIILIFEPISRVIASIHSGRKGTEKNIAGAVVDKLIQNFDLQPKNLLAYI